jgi:hypothetical protein
VTVAIIREPVKPARKVLAGGDNQALGCADSSVGTLTVHSFMKLVTNFGLAFLCL